MKNIFSSICGYLPNKESRHSIYNLSGIRAIWEKLLPPSPDQANSKPKPSTFILWAVSIYVALFSIATARYDRAIDTHNMLIPIFQTQIAAKDKKSAYNTAKLLDGVFVPIEPIFFNPFTTVSSFWKTQKYDLWEIILVKTIESYKKDLADAELDGLELEFVDLTEAQLEGANFTNTNLIRADCRNANLHKTNFTSANLSGADLRDTDLTSAVFANANCTNTLFYTPPNFNQSEIVIEVFNTRESIVKKYDKNIGKKDTHVAAKQLSHALTLYQAEIPQDIKAELLKTHPHLFSPKPPQAELINKINFKGRTIEFFK